MGMEKSPLSSFFSGLGQPQKYARFPIWLAILLDLLGLAHETSD
jgi:Na+-transporting NADH:ubiquinone oxidoreductase subunit NqrD